MGFVSPVVKEGVQVGAKSFILPVVDVHEPEDVGLFTINRERSQEGRAVRLIELHFLGLVREKQFVEN